MNDLLKKYLEKLKNPRVLIIIGVMMIFGWMNKVLAVFS